MTPSKMIRMIVAICFVVFIDYALPPLSHVKRSASKVIRLRHATVMSVREPLSEIAVTAISFHLANPKNAKGAPPSIFQGLPAVAYAHPGTDIFVDPFF